MSAEPNIGDPAVHTRSGPSIVWLIPVITALVGGWLVVKTLSEQGPEATISFKTAEGIEVGKTRIKYKSVEIGVIEDVQFAEDFESVILTAKFNQGTEHFLRRNTRFWVVKPQLSVRGVSGLETLVSGAYIEIDPGPGAPQRHFVGLEEQPLITTDDAGSRITLITEDLGSVDAGSPIYYQGLLAGEVLGKELASDAQSVYVYAFVRDPFDQLIRGNTRFWNISGIDVSLGADGVRVQTSSLVSMMFGGIAFETPDKLEHTPADISDLIFTLHDSYAEITAQAFTHKLRFVMYFEGSVRGLNPGAPVEFKGIKIGEVIDVRLEFNRADSTFQIPVVVELEPDRIVDRTPDANVPPEETLRALVDRGLRGQLQTGSLLTGQLYIAMDMFPNAPLDLHEDTDAPYPELPTVPGTFEALTATLQDFVAQLDAVDLDEMANHLLGILRGADNLLNTKESTEVVTDLQASMRALKNILREVDEGDVDATIIAATTVLEDLQQTLELTNEVLVPNSPFQYNLNRMTSELEETARAIRALLELLQRQPNALIFGKGDTEDPGEEQP